MPIFDFLRRNARLLGAGFLLALASSFGQTFFIALFSEPLREEFSLSHGQFGTIYMVATLASAACLVPLGRLADTVSTRRLSLAVLLGLAAICVAMSLASSWSMLLAVIFGLRLFGQGFLGQLARVAMARWFTAARGRALAFASFGHPTGEALAPLLVITLFVAVGWRGTWGLCAAMLVLVFVPVIWFLLAKEPTQKEMDDNGGFTTGLEGRHWSRGEAISQPLFWLLIPGLIAPSLILTTIFFLPSHIAEAKGWAFEAIPSCYWIYALSSVTAGFASGMAIDRFSARACLPLYLLPLATGLVVLWSASSTETIPVMMMLLGFTGGAANTVQSALWAEIYGTRHIGTIKALAHAIMVVSTAVGPGMAGALIDAGISFPMQALWFAAYVAAVSTLYLWITFRSIRPAGICAPR